MKLVWSPETASKAYIDTVKSCEVFKESSVAELISAMAAGWNAKLIVETWVKGGTVATSIGLAVASRHTGGRHICIVPDVESRSEYLSAMKTSGMAAEVVVGLPEQSLKELEGIDFLVVDSNSLDFGKMVRVAKLGNRGSVLVCKNATSTEFQWRSILGGGFRVVRSVFLPVGKGLDIAHVGMISGDKSSGKGKGKRRWIKHTDRDTGEMFVIRK